MPAGLIVAKFGGASLAHVGNIHKTVDIIRNIVSRASIPVIVLSAFGGVTDLLIEIGEKSARQEAYAELVESLRTRHFAVINDLVSTSFVDAARAETEALFAELLSYVQGVSLLRDFAPKYKDLILSFGEQLSSQIMCWILKSEGFPDATNVDARKLIVTDYQYGSANVDFATTNQRIHDYFGTTAAKSCSVHTVTGFIASTPDGSTTTLGRSGSDYSAAIFGAALDATEIEFWKDVAGVLTGDPRKVGAAALRSPALSYAEALELSFFGAKVIMPSTVGPALAKEIPLVLKCFLYPDAEGTRITAEPSPWPYAVRGVSSLDDIVLVNLKGRGIVGVTEVCSRVFAAFVQASIDVILISQSCAKHSLSCGVMPGMAAKAQEVLLKTFRYEITNSMIDSIELETGRAIVAVVGATMHLTPGVVGRLFMSLGKASVNVLAIASGSSEHNISVVVDSADVETAVCAVHGEFFPSVASNGCIKPEKAA